jgi:adenylate kinase family enzyme
VTGPTGAGKTTRARRLSKLLGLELLELDELPFIIHPTKPLSSDELRASLTPRLREADAWIVDSEMSEVPPEAWQRATTVIWLDMPRNVRVWGILRRHGVVLVLGMRSGHGITRRRVLGDLRYAWRFHTHVTADYERRLLQLDLPADVVRTRDREAVERLIIDFEQSAGTA